MARSTPPQTRAPEWRRPPRAAFAVDPARTRGRLHAEPESPHRSPFQRDRDRIIHANAFRRLKHKTQVFVEHEGDYYRTRLTHSIEVAQIARTLARALGLDEDLAEAVALAHDLGHPPFGHAGETELDALMGAYGGFDHNAQALRVVTELERRYAEFDGLNLTWETLEGLVKHNGPVTGAAAAAYGLAAYDARHGLALASHASAEAQAAAIADDIAYNNHDLDDGLRAGLFTYDEIAALALAAPSAQEVAARWPGLEPDRRNFETSRRVFGRMVEDVIAESARRLAELAPADADAVRAAGAPVVAFSPALEAELDEVRRFLFARMYRHTRVNRMMSKARRTMRDLFALFVAEPNLLPSEWRDRAEAATHEAGRARVAADYIAGMTDRYAMQEHRQLFDAQARAR
ncbi:MAG: deoxyguanosinetriphosphate triphosphohydrolase [Pseudomonadota bacterium]